MSGHSKWSTIKRKKGAADTKRGQAFTKLASALTIAAKEGGGDPESNFALRLVMDRARAANMPNANVERAIKRGTGDLAGETAPEQITYEAFGPGGVALLIECLTDNRNRTVSDVRSRVTKRGGSLGETGSVNYLFNTKGVITLPRATSDPDAVLETALEAGASEIEVEDEVIEVETNKASFARVKQALESAGHTVESAELAQVAVSSVPVTDKATANALVSLLTELEELDDIVSVSTNADIEPALIDG